MAESFIHAENLSFSYKGQNGADDIPALKGVTLDIQKGEYVAVLGHNGSGKSTFAKLLNLILEPTSGTLIVGGTDLSSGDLPDDELIALRRRVDDALAAVGMSEYTDREPHHLSGGQKQRVAIAGIIAMRPECIVFDESTAMLDPLGRREVLDTIRMLNRENGITIINITHYMNEAALADRVIVINDGSILMDGTPDEVFARRNELRAVGLEVPQCAELIYRLREAGIPVRGTEISTVEACADLLSAAFSAEGNHHG